MDYFPKKYYPSFYFLIYFLYFLERVSDTVCFFGELCKLWYLKVEAQEEDEEDV